MKKSKWADIGLTSRASFVRSQAGLVQREIDDLESLELQRENLFHAARTAFTLHQWEELYQLYRGLCGEKGLLRWKGYSQEACEFYELCIQAARTTNDKSWLLAALTSLGTFLRQTADFEKAIEVYREALVLVQEEGDTKSEAKLWMNLGNIYQSSENYSDAHNAYGQAREIIENIKEPDKHQRTIICALLINQGSCLSLQSKYVDAIEFFNRALPLALELEDTRRLAAVYSGLGDVQARLRNYEAAQGYFEQALEFPLNESDRGDCLGNLGDVFLRLGMLDKAETFLRDAINIHKATENKLNLRQWLLSLGEVNLLRASNSKNIEGFEYFKKIGIQVLEEGIAICNEVIYRPEDEPNITKQVKAALQNAYNLQPHSS